jgi:hypothetical protein
MVYFGNATILQGDAAGGSIPAAFERIHEVIQDLNPELFLAHIPPENRSVFDKHPFAVVCKPTNGMPPYVVMTMEEKDVNHTIVAKLIQRDTRRGATIDRMEAEEAALRLINMKQQLEDMEERREFAQSVLKSKKHFYRHDGKVYH